jgi:hypothetical protein
MRQRGNAARRRRCSPAIAVLFASGSAVAVWAQAPAIPQPPPPAPPNAPRDIATPQPRTVPVGAGSIVGIVTAAENGRPLRNARVSLIGAAGSASAPPVDAVGRGLGAANVIPLSRATITDSLGQFTFQQLPAGEFNLSVTRSQYLTTNYGQKKAGRPGSRIVLADGQQLRLTVPMQRGGVITGAVTSDDGEPASNAQVRALRYMYVNGFKRLQQSGFASTDDRGVYRLFNLQPGDYVISATPNTSDLNMSERLLSDSIATEQAIAEAVRTSAGASRSGGEVLYGTVSPATAGQPAVVVIPPAPTTRSTPPGYLPTYFPSVPSPASATTITINPGDERAGVDVQLQLLQATLVQGTISNPVPNTRVQVTLIADDPLSDSSMRGASITRPDGHFELANIAPGAYTVFAQTMPLPPAPQVVNSPATGFVTMPRLDDTQRFWAKSDVRVDGQPVLDVPLSLQPGKSISGVIRYDGPPPRGGSQDRPSIQLAMAPSSQQVALVGPPPAAEIGADGRFTISGVVPGKYTFRSNRGGTIKSAIAAGEDMLDFPLDLSGDRDIGDVVVTLTDKVTELSGTLSDATGNPALDYVVLLAPKDQRYWTPGGRRIMTTRPDSRGHYSFSNPPPGDYLIAALTDLEPGAQYDPDFLKTLVGASMAISIAEGGRQTQDIRLAR